MYTVGFPITNKENEFRRALLPQDVLNIDRPEFLYFEKGYGNVLGYTDNDYVSSGANIAEHDEILSMDIICDAKIGDADYLDKLNNQIIFGWVHAVQNRDITEKIIKNNLSAFAWEDMYSLGRHTFYRNNEIAGEAAILHAIQFYGDMLYNAKVAIIGNGNIAKGAFKILAMLGADITSYNRKTEVLLRKEVNKFDIIVNAILWDTSREDHILYKSDLKNMKKGSLIIDISCDENGGIETSVPTTIESPVYKVDGVLHYVVDHTPSIIYKASSKSISHACVPYINQLISGEYEKTLKESLIIEKGEIIDNRIKLYQSR